MKAFVITIFVVTFAALALCNPKPQKTDEEKKTFEEWKKTHKKEYASAVEEAAAMELILALAKEIKDHNKLYDEGKTSYRRELHEHSDKDDKDWEQSMHGYEEHEDEKAAEEDGEVEGDRMKRERFPPGPDAIDWNEKGLVTKVENQREF